MHQHGPPERPSRLQGLPTTRGCHIMSSLCVFASLASCPRRQHHLTSCAPVQLSVPDSILAPPQHALALLQASGRSRNTCLPASSSLSTPSRPCQVASQLWVDHQCGHADTYATSQVDTQHCRAAWQPAPFVLLRHLPTHDCARTSTAAVAAACCGYLSELSAYQASCQASVAAAMHQSAPVPYRG